MTATKMMVYEAPAQPETTYNHAMGYLRAFVVVLVVAHHVALAYHPYAPPPAKSLAAQPRLWQAFPVVDGQRGAWAALLTGFNDTFFMSLMFLLSGLFVWHGLKSKGPVGFLRGRLQRLGLPFVVAAGMLAPLAYYPAYLQTTGHGGFDAFVRQWLSLGDWPAGPAWFVWVLMTFDCIVALLFSMAPRWAESVGDLVAGHSARPARLFALLAAGSALVYIPLELIFNGMYWSSFGPFFFQTSRILHYLLYFMIGTGIGAWGLENGPLASDGRLARRWVLWTNLAALVFVAATAVTIGFLTAHLQSNAWHIATDLMFSATCATSCFAFLAVFLRFARSRSGVWQSVSANSYGIYLLHYAFVSWFLLAMTGAAVPAILKFTTVTCAAVAASWATTALLRRIPKVVRVI